MAGSLTVHMQHEIVRLDYILEPDKYWGKIPTTVGDDPHVNSAKAPIRKRLFNFDLLLAVGRRNENIYPRRDTLQITPHFSSQFFMKDMNKGCDGTLVRHGRLGRDRTSGRRRLGEILERNRERQANVAL